MINNQSFTYYHHWFFYHCLSSLILVGLLGACNRSPEPISTVPPTPTQQSSQLLTATQQPIEHVVSPTSTQPSSGIPTATQRIPLTTPMDDNAGPLPPDNNSGGINLEQDSLIPPIPPGQLTVVSTQDCPQLKWPGTGSDIIVSYKIYRRPLATEIWDLIASVAMEGDNRGSYTFCDKTIEYQPSSYEYAISAQDHYGNESNLSEPKAIK